MRNSIRCANSVCNVSWTREKEGERERENRGGSRKERTRVSIANYAATSGGWSPRYHLHGFRPTSIRHYSSRNARHNLENHAPRRVARGGPAIFSARDTTAISWSAYVRRRISARHTIELELSKIISPPSSIAVLLPRQHPTPNTSPSLRQCPSPFHLTLAEANPSTSTSRFRKIHPDYPRPFFPSLALRIDRSTKTRKLKLNCSRV